ncbi:unnamed protein product [Penicillium salamii]|uniref:F-box domain-containing protein n=1 Tax=Penicillium salamii TaxID=1612424 RepID=A0A9W4IXH1_9EURO|nr:unnamed protein product [Penicillium salamii]
MASTLPPEILLMITSLSDTATLKSLRLTSRDICASATQSLFRTVTLFDRDDSCNAVESIMTHPSLRGQVRNIYLQTVEEDYDLDRGMPDEIPDPPEKWRKLLAMLPTLPNLESVALRFDKNCCEDSSLFGDAVQTEGYRNLVMKWLLSEVVALPRPLKELAIQNNQNTTGLGVYGDEILGGLVSLRLNTVHEADEAAPENEVEKPEFHDFFNRLLPTVWLKPAMSSLRNLTLYSDMYWGFYPRSPLKGIHFPNLQSLTLGNYCFFEDAQLDWILSHSTLQDIHLDDCAILFQIYLCAEDPPDLGIIPRSSMQQDPEKGNGFFHTYPRRWSDYFASLESGLPHLRHFAIGRSNWEDGLPFEQEQDIKSALLHDRYLVFDHGIGPSPFQEYPLCDEQDRTALVQLYEKIGQKIERGLRDRSAPSN